MKKTFVIILLGVLNLSACQQPNYTHEYLLQHPSVVQQELAKCRKNSEYTAYCDQVKNASDEFDALIEVRAQDPFLFGQQILKSQIHYVEAKIKLRQLEQDYIKARATNSITRELEDSLIQANIAYREQAQKVKILLAVVAEMSLPGL